jgi:hypothetical protein
VSNKYHNPESGCVISARLYPKFHVLEPPFTLGSAGAQDELFGEVGVGRWVAGVGGDSDFSKRWRGCLGGNRSPPERAVLVTYAAGRNKEAPVLPSAMRFLTKNLERLGAGAQPRSTQDLVFDLKFVASVEE